MVVPLNQVTNPTDEQRREMIRNSLETEGRPEDYEYIVNLLSIAGRTERSKNRRHRRRAGRFIRCIRAS